MLTEAFNIRIEDAAAMAVAQQILAERPDLEQLRPEPLRRGMCSYIFFAGDEVFKAALNPAASRSLMQEMNLQRALYEQGLPVPEITYMGRQSAFYGMVRVPGPGLNDIKAFMTPEEIMGIIRDMTALQADIMAAGDMLNLPGIDREYGHVLQKDIIHQTRRIVELPAVKKALRAADNADYKLSKYFSRIAARKPVLVHNDLHGGNIMVDKERLKIDKVIDFGIARYTLMPESDLRCIETSYNHEFFERFSTAYFNSQHEITEQDYRLFLLCRDLSVYFSSDDAHAAASRTGRLDDIKEKACALGKPL